MSGDELIGNVIQVVADDLRLRADFQQIITNTLDQRSFQPAATAPSVSQVWQAIMQSSEGLTPSSFST